MRDTSLRWGIGMGVAAAAIGVLARLIGMVMAPIPAYTTAETVVVSLAIQGFLTLGSIGVALVLANYAGQRVERDREATVALASANVQDGEPQAREDRSGSLLAGLYVMLCFWFVIALYNAMGPPVQQGGSRQPLNIPVLLISGVLYALLGAGCGGLGGRTVVARRLLRGVVKPAQALASASATSMPASASMPAPAPTPPPPAAPSTSSPTPSPTQAAAEPPVPPTGAGEPPAASD